MSNETTKRILEIRDRFYNENEPGQYAIEDILEAGYTAAHNDAQGVTSKLLHAEDALWSIVQSHGYKLTAEFALTLANEYFKKFKDTPYKELDDAQGEIEKLKAENERIQQFSREEGARLFDCQNALTAERAASAELLKALENGRHLVNSKEYVDAYTLLDEAISAHNARQKERE